MEATSTVQVTPLCACDNGAEIVPSELASWADDQSSIDDDEDPDDKRLCRAGYEAVLPAPPTGRCSAAWARDRLYELGCFRPPI